MFFKNAVVYGVRDTDQIVAANFEEHRVADPAPNQPGTVGWEEPVEGGGYLFQSGDFVLVCMETRTRLLPPDVVRREVKALCDGITKARGFAPGRKERREIREDVEARLLPQAFIKPARTYAYFDVGAGHLVIDTGSADRAEMMLSLLASTGVILRLINTNKPVVGAMTELLLEGERAGFAVGDSCCLQAIDDSGRVVTYRNGFDDAQIRADIEAGRLPTRLSLCYHERLSFDITDRRHIKKIGFFDVVKERVEELGAEDADGVFRAQLAIMGGEMQHMLRSLILELGGEQREETK